MMVMSKLALLLSASWCLRAAWGQEEGEFTQSEEAFFEELYDNGADDSAVAGVWFRDYLYVAITTGPDVELAGDRFGEIDLVVKSFDADLEDEEATQLGGDGDDFITAIAAPDLSATVSDIVIVGSTESVDDHLFPDLQVNATGGQDWFIATLDRLTLEVVLAFVDGTEFEGQEATAVAITGDGEYIVAGTAGGDYISENAGAANDEDEIGLDLFVVKMDADLSEFLWSVQMGTIAYEKPTAVVVDADSGNVYVVGNTADFSEILTTAQTEDFQSMFVYCLNGDDGEEEWSVTDELGVLSDGGQVHGAVLTTNTTEDIQLYISGSTQGIIPGFEGNSTGSDELFIVSLDPADGSINWVWQSEGEATAFGTGGIVLADDGLTPIVSGIAFGNHFNLSSSYWVPGKGDMIAAMVDTEKLEVSKYYVATPENADTRQDPYALVKVDDEPLGVYMIGINDGEWGEDSDPEDESNYLILKVILEDIPEDDEEGDSGYDFPYWYVGVPVFAIGGVLFLVAYKWAAASQAAKAKQATMV